MSVLYWYCKQLSSTAVNMQLDSRKMLRRYSAVSAEHLVLSNEIYYSTAGRYSMSSIVLKNLKSSMPSTSPNHIQMVDLKLSLQQNHKQIAALIADLF